MPVCPLFSRPCFPGGGWRCFPPRVWARLTFPPIGDPKRRPRVDDPAGHSRAIRSGCDHVVLFAIAPLVKSPKPKSRRKILERIARGRKDSDVGKASVIEICA